MRGLRVSVSSPGFFIDPDFIFFDLCGLFFILIYFFGDPSPLGWRIQVSSCSIVGVQGK